MANQVILIPPAILNDSPSFKQGLDPQIEVNLRIYGCQLIQKVGKILCLQGVSIASGQTILHRFYYRRSLQSFDIRKFAAAALYLACKLEEDPQSIRDVILAFQYLFVMEDFPDPDLRPILTKEDLDALRNDVLLYERYALRELGFLISQALVHPHRYILQYIHSLFVKHDSIDLLHLSQKAWGYLNDSMCSSLCCKVQPAVIAVGSIYLAACDLNICLPRSTHWYELFDVTWSDVVNVCTSIRYLYCLPRAVYIKLNFSEVKGESLEITNKSESELSSIASLGSASENLDGAFSMRPSPMENGSNTPNLTVHKKESICDSAKLEVSQELSNTRSNSSFHHPDKRLKAEPAETMNLSFKRTSLSNMNRLSTDMIRGRQPMKSRWHSPPSKFNT